MEFDSLYFLNLDYRPGVGVIIEKGPHQDMCGKVNKMSYSLQHHHILIKLTNSLFNQN